MEIDLWFRVRGWWKSITAYECYISYVNGMSSGVEEVKSDAAVDAAAEKNGEFERVVVRH